MLSARHGIEFDTPFWKTAQSVLLFAQTFVVMVVVVSARTRRRREGRGLPIAKTAGEDKNWQPKALCVGVIATTLRYIIGETVADVRLSMRRHINVHVQHHHARPFSALLNPALLGPALQQQ